MEQAWVAKCEGCGLFCVLYEEVEFVCGKCHGAINPGPQLSIAVSAALDTLYDVKLPTEAVLSALWEQRYSC